MYHQLLFPRDIPIVFVSRKRKEKKPLCFCLFHYSIDVVYDWGGVRESYSPKKIKHALCQNQLYMARHRVNIYLKSQPLVPLRQEAGLNCQGSSINCPRQQNPISKIKNKIYHFSNKKIIKSMSQPHHSSQGWLN